MKIAILGWGSLLWDPRELKIKGDWIEDGPMLPIEFAKLSSYGRLTLVIKPGFPAVQTLYAESAYSTIEEARQNLQERERTKSIDTIGYINFTNNASKIGRIEDEIEKILTDWNKEKKYDAIIWTDLGPNFSDRTGKVFSISNVIEYLGSLQSEEFAKAKEYIINAPSQVQTQFRKEITAFLEPITTITEEEFIKKYVFNHKRKIIFDIFRTQLEIIKRHCYAFQMLCIGSFVDENYKDSGKLKEDPDDLDVVFFGNVRPVLAERLQKHGQNGLPLIPFTIYDKELDITPITANPYYEFTYFGTGEMLLRFNKINKYESKWGVEVKEYQRKPEITYLKYKSKLNNEEEFQVDEEQFEFKDYKGIEYSIRHNPKKFAEYFTFKILFIQNRILVLLVMNNDILEVSGKGIVKEMIKKISAAFKLDVISSTRIEDLKIDPIEGRVPKAHAYWLKWLKEDPLVSYIVEEDRFLYKYSPK